MKIVHIIFDLNTGGAETMLVDIINEQVKTVSVTLIVVNNQINEKLLDQIDKKVKLILIGRKERSRNPIPIIKLNWHLLKLNPYVIHCHNESVVRIIIFRNKCVLTVHDVNIATKNFKFYIKLFAISKSVKKDIEQRSGIKPIVVYNGIRIDAIKQKENYDFNIFKIVQVSRLDHEKKGQHILLEALNTLVYKKEITNICVDFIGEGNSLAYLKKLVEGYNLNEFVNFLGICDRQYIYNHLKDYNLLIQPSLYEGFGLTIAEAMAAKVPVLVSDIDGPMEIVDYGNHGYFFRTGKPKICAEKILTIMNDSLSTNFKNKMEDSACFVQTKFDIKITASMYIEYYRYIKNGTN